MDVVLQTISDNWSTLVTAPWGFGAVLVLGLIIGWSAAYVHFRERLRARKERLKQAKEQLAASPVLERQIEAAITGALRNQVFEIPGKQIAVSTTSVHSSSYLAALGGQSSPDDAQSPDEVYRGVVLVKGTTKKEP